MEAELIKKFKHDIIDQGSEYYVKASIIREFITTCSQYNLAVIGIEGFTIEPQNKLLPQMDMIEDLSEIQAENWVEYRFRCNQLALKLIDEIMSAHQTKNLIFNLVLFNEQEYEEVHSQ